MRKRLAPFVKHAFQTVDPGTKYKHNWHIDLICAYLEALTFGELGSQKLIINIPPRFLKSIIVTVAWPAWLLGRDPSEQILTSSYSSKLSVDHCMSCRLVTQSPWYRATFPDVELASDQNEKSRFKTTEQGLRAATSVGGASTGMGGNFLIVDDPLDPERAASEAERTTANNWIDQTWSSRKNDPETAAEVVVMQRLHQNDVTGHLLEQGGWEHLKVPQEATVQEYFSIRDFKHCRKPGELLHPERMGQEHVDDARRRLGTSGYEAQQQQEPTPPGGDMVKLDWFRRYRTAPARSEVEFLRFSLDTAYKEKDLNDPSVVGVWGLYQNVHYLLYVWRDRVGYPKLRHVVKNMAAQWHPDEIIIEDKASGQSLAQDLAEDGWPAIPIKPEGDKVVRMDNQAPMIEAGLVAVPEQAPWLHKYEQELLHFPRGEHDDQVDMTSQYLKRAKEPGEMLIG
jgi:predicted phage terminase large subunit-like protein